MVRDPDALLATLPFFRELGEEGRAFLARRIRAVAADPDAPLLSPGDTVSGVYFVEAGSVRVHYLDAAGREGTLYRLEAGQSCILAQNCVFSEMEYPAWANAEEAGASLLLLDGPAARELVRMDAAFLKALFAYSAERLFQLLGTLEQAIRLPLEARLAQLMLDLAGTGDEVCLSQERLAGHLGTTRESVSRLLRAMVRQGVVESHYGRIVIVDPAALQRRCR